MNWKNEATEKLKRYSTMRVSLENLRDEIKRLELESRSIRCACVDGVSVRTSGGQKDVLLNNLIKKQEVKDSLHRTKLWLSCTDRALESLSEEERMLLREMYIYPQKGSMQNLCVRLGVEQSSVYRRRDAALEHFTQALYGYGAL